NSSEERKTQKTNMKNYLQKISRQITYAEAPKFTEESDLDNLFITCAVERGKKEREYCHKKKLLIEEDKLNELIEIFIDDLVNPIKRDYLLNSILINNIQNYFQFEKRKDEEIYVKFE